MVERSGSPLGRSAGGWRGNRSQPMPFGFSLPPDGNSKVGRTHQIWRGRRALSKRGQKNRAAHFSFSNDGQMKWKMYDVKTSCIFKMRHIKGGWVHNFLFHLHTHKTNKQSINMLTITVSL